MACLRGNQKNFICLFGFSDGKSVKRQRHDCDGSNEMRYTGHDEFFLKMLRQQNYGSHIGTGTHTKFQTLLVRYRMCMHDFRLTMILPVVRQMERYVSVYFLSPP